MYLNPEAEHLLDWFHITMRLTVLKQIAKGLPGVGEAEDQYELRSHVVQDLESLKWYLWHGNVFEALQELLGLELDLDGAAFGTQNETARKLLKGIEELHTYVERNQALIPNYGERYRKGGEDRLRLRRICGQSGCQQADGEATTNGVESARRTSLAAAPDAGAQRGMGKHVSELVPSISAHGRSGGLPRRLIPRNLPLSRLSSDCNGTACHLPSHRPDAALRLLLRYRSVAPKQNTRHKLLVDKD